MSSDNADILMFVSFVVGTVIGLIIGATSTAYSDAMEQMRGGPPVFKSSNVTRARWPDCDPRPRPVVFDCEEVT